MEKATHVELGGRRFVILAREEYERLLGLEKLAAMAPLPEPDAEGNYPAVEYARASIARGIVRERVELGLTQRELAQLAGVRVETLCRIETGRHTASTPTIEKLDQALRRARDGAAKPAASKRPRTRSPQHKRATKRGRKAS